MEIPDTSIPKPTLWERILWTVNREAFQRHLERKVEKMRQRHKCVWRCVRDQGGGLIHSPKLTEAAAIDWVGRNLGEVIMVDFAHRHIFYRSQS
jgi:hypothetical protein